MLLLAMASRILRHMRNVAFKGSKDSQRDLKTLLRGRKKRKISRSSKACRLSFPQPEWLFMGKRCQVISNYNFQFQKTSSKLIEKLQKFVKFNLRRSTRSVALKLDFVFHSSCVSKRWRSLSTWESSTSPWIMASCRRSSIGTNCKLMCKRILQIEASRLVEAGKTFSFHFLSSLQSEWCLCQRSTVSDAKLSNVCSQNAIEHFAFVCRASCEERIRRGTRTEILRLFIEIESITGTSKHRRSSPGSCQN